MDDENTYDLSNPADRSLLVKWVRQQVCNAYGDDWVVRCPEVAYHALHAIRQLGVTEYRLVAGRVEEATGDRAVLFRGDYTGSGASQYHTWLVNGSGEKIDCSIVPLKYKLDYLWEPFHPLPALAYTEVVETTAAVAKAICKRYGK